MPVLRALKVSRISNHTDDSTSLARQELAEDRVIADRGMVPVGHAVDDGVSASKISPFDRRGLGPWLTDPVKINSFDVMVIWRLDRIVRSMHDLQVLAGWAKKHNKKLIFAEGPGGSAFELDMTNIIGELIVMLLAFVAQMEAQNTKERVQSSHNYLATQPRWPGGAAPYGYRIIPRIVDGVANGKTLEIVPEEARILWEIVDLIILDGASLQSVVVQLNKAGTPSPRSGYTYKNGTPSWGVTSLGRMLRSVTLMGHKAFKGKPVLTAEGDPVILADGILTPSEFRVLQLALAKRSGEPTRTKNTAPLTGIIFCGICGGPAYRQPERIHKGYRLFGHYLCYGKRNKGILPCRGVRLNEAPLTARINEAFLENIGPLDRPVKKFIAGSDHMAELEAVECGLKNLQAESDAGLIRDQQKYIERLRALTVRKEKLAALPAEPDRWEEVPSGKACGQWWEESPEPMRRDLLLDAGFRVVLLPGGNTVAYWPGKSGLSLEEFMETLPR